MSDAEKMPIHAQQERAWLRLRGALKDVFANLGGGDAYLNSERDEFYPTEHPPSGKVERICLDE